MKTKTKKLVLLLVIGLIFPLFVNTNSNYIVKQKTILENPKHSGGYVEPYIYVTGATWASTASSEPWCYLDNGVYIIENVTVDASSSPTGSGILIENSAVDFIIRNCTLSNAGTGPLNAGIMLDHVDKGTIYNNTCLNNGRNGIMLYYGEDNNISRNVLKNNKWEGIYVSYNCRNNNFTNNVCKNNTRNGLYLWKNGEKNKISFNIAYENGEAGIKLHDNCFNNTLSNNTIKGNRYGMYIISSDINSITNNTAIENSESGIYLYDSSENNNITGNTADHNHRYGIHLTTQSNLNNITRNTVNDNTMIGIYLQAMSDNNRIKNNTINRNDLGIGLDYSDYNNISRNILQDNNWCIYEITDCIGTIIEFNDCSPSTVQLPISIDDTATGVGAHNWTWAINQPWCSGGPGSDWDSRYIIENLKISGFGIMSGIEIINSNAYFEVKNCTIYHSRSIKAGIYLEHVANATLFNNNCSNNLGSGILLFFDCSYNNITENVANNNHNGISVNDECDNNTISHNTAKDNDGVGILIYGGGRDSCHNNTISENTANDNNYGIQLKAACHFNKISGNTIKGNKFGITLDSDLSILDYNDIIENIIYNNTQGIYITSGCNNNSIYNNFFLENGKHAVDDGTDNYWNSTSIGNYWDNHTGPDSEPDGIVDIPYNISTLVKDYLPIAEDGAPTIDITSPTLGEIFGVSVPSFNVIVTDDYLDEMWYTIDGGLHNYSCTENDIIDQSAWDIAAEGNVTLTFYASDIPGNIGTEEVMIIKDYEAPIITINSPATGEYFGSTAPSFNVRITDDYLVSMWYTIDGGLHNYTFTTNSTINQTVWGAMIDGAIALTFYANDNLGHIGTAGVSIIKDTFAPIIIVTSPVEGEKFGNISPLFNITIEEDNLDAIWYSFDGGLTTYTITSNGTLNQAAWTALAQGEIIITFYASDLAGNEGSESVTVIKSVPSGLDPGMIITIVVVSIVGGVAVISVIYIFMKQRMAPV